MITSPITYAELIIDASERIKKARDPDTAMAALDELKGLLEDHTMIHLMASMFQLLAAIYVEETAPQQSCTED